MAIYFVRPTNGLDTNDGLDFHGFALATATFTTSTKNLNKTGAFSGYTFNSGDTIYISGGTGVTPGLYPIASKTDNDNIVLVDDIGGTDPSDVTSSDGAFKTTQKAADTAIADDTVRLCKEATETISAQIDFDTNAGASTTPITFMAASSVNGVQDRTSPYTIQASSAITTIISPSVTLEINHLWFLDVVFDANSNSTYVFRHNDDQSGFWKFWNCRMTGATSHGFSSRTEVTLMDCEIDNNGGRGVDWVGSNRGMVSMFGGSIHDNTDDGAISNSNATPTGGLDLHNVLIYDNGGDGVQYQTATNGQIIENCVIYGNTGHGINMNGTSGNKRIVNNSIASNGGYGILFGAGSPYQFLAFDYNHYDNNTSGDSDVTLIGHNDISGDPLFTSVTDGSEDFTPLAHSPLKSAGLNGCDIGAIRGNDANPPILAIGI